MSTLSERSQEFNVFQFTPGLSMVVLPDAPVYTIVAASNDFVELIGLKRSDIVGKSHREFLPSNSNDPDFVEREDLLASLAFVVKNKKRHEIPCRRYDMGLGEDLIIKYWSIRNEPVLSNDGELLYIIHSLTDITDKVLAEQKVQSMTGIENAYKFFMQAPVVIGYVRGAGYEIEMANQDLLRVWKVGADVIGKKLFDVFPELEPQGFRQLLDDVRLTGKPFIANEFPIIFKREDHDETFYFDFVYQPFFDGDDAQAKGVIAVGHDVTDRVIAKTQLRDSEKKWKELANSMPVIVWTASSDGNITFLNDRWQELTGLDQSQSLGYGWTKALHPDDHDRCLRVWSDARSRETRYEIEVRYRKADGAFLWTIVRGVPVHTDGKLTGWYGTSTDVHKLKQLENHLEERVKEGTREVYEKNMLLDSILKNSSNGISVSEMIFDDQGRVVDARTILANDAAVNLIGLPRDLYLTKPATFFDPNIITSDYGQACIKTIKTGEPFIMRYFLSFSKRWLELTVSKMDDKRLIHIFTDVTSIHEAQSKLENTLRELRESNANLEQFAYAASHDLKEPIRKYQFFTNMLKEGLKDILQPNQHALFDRLEQTSGRMHKLVTDLLEYSQAANGAAEHVPLNLDTVITGVLDDLELEVQKRQAKVSCDPLPSISGNRRQMHQLFQNLISNALKYSTPNVIPVITITHTTVSGKDVSNPVPFDAQEKSFHLIQVKDNGIGFEQRYADKIFKIFTRLHDSSYFRGSGVGLSIVKKVVEAHNGFIWADSKPGEGATFSILIPVSYPEQ